MEIRCISDLDQFDRLRPDWDAAYAADPHATIFVSWSWLRGWLESTPDEWLVLAARPDRRSEYVAFLPLAQPLHKRWLTTAGKPLSDHTGFVCQPAYSQEAIRALALFVRRRLRWNRLWILETQDPRLDLFLSYFPSTRFHFRRTQTSCPYIPLPESWDEYLHSLSSNARKNMRRCLRRITDDDQVRVTVAQADDLDQLIETLLVLWQERWGPHPLKLENLDMCRTILRSCFEGDCLSLYTLWQADTPIALLSCYVDRLKGTVSAHTIVWDKRFAKMSPGNMLIGYAIRDAIQSGMRVYDFLRGGEEYKVERLGAVVRSNTSAFVTRKNLHLAVVKLVAAFRPQPTAHGTSPVGLRSASKGQFGTQSQQPPQRETSI